MGFVDNWFSRMQMASCLEVKQVGQRFLVGSKFLKFFVRVAREVVCHGP